MSKQDRQGVRSASDIERKYNFGKSFAEVMGVAEKAVETAKEATKLDEKLTSDEIFNRLTNNGQLQGLYRGDDGELYVNATYIKSGILHGDRINGKTLKIQNGSTIAGWSIDENSIYNGADFATSTFMCRGSSGAYSIGGSESLSGWVFGAGGKFGVTKDGAMYANDVHLEGEIEASGGHIAGWHIGNVNIVSNAGVVYSGAALYSDDHYDEYHHTQAAVALTPDKVYVYGRDETGATFVDYASWGRIVASANNG